MFLLRKCALKTKCPKPLENRLRILNCQCMQSAVNCFVVTLNSFKTFYIMFIFIILCCKKHLGKGRPLGKY